MENLFLGDGLEWSRRLAMTMMILPFLIIAKRLGKQELDKLNAFDISLGISYGIVLSYLLLVPNTSFVAAIFLLSLLTLLQFLRMKFKDRSNSIHDFFRKDPYCIYLDGEFNELLMKRKRISTKDVQYAVRAKGIDSLKQVNAVLLQDDGTLFVVAKSSIDPRKARTRAKGH